MNQTAKKTNMGELSILKISVGEKKITAEISDGRTVSIPIAWFPRLIGGTKEQLGNFEISPAGYGIHWPDLDEDISIKSFIS